MLLIMEDQYSNNFIKKESIQQEILYDILIFCR